MSSMLAHVESVIREAVVGLGFEFVGIEHVVLHEKQTLRLYIDGENGITVGQIQRVSRHISRLLDVEWSSSSRYHLEVSSPGLDRRLFEPQHFQRFVGAQCKLTLKVAVLGHRRQFTGVIVDAAQHQVRLKVATIDEPMLFDYEQIQKARLVPDLTRHN